MTIPEKHEQAFQYLAEYDIGVESENMMLAVSALEESLSYYEVCHAAENDYMENVLDFDELRNDIKSLEQYSTKWQKNYRLALANRNDIIDEIESIHKASLTNCMYHNTHISPSSIAANVFCDIIFKHVLADGNKRLAVLVLIWMTQRLGLSELSDEWYAAAALVVAKFGNSRKEDLVDMLTGMLAE